jgi:hypothetical protein
MGDAIVGWGGCRFSQAIKLRVRVTLYINARKLKRKLVMVQEAKISSDKIKQKQIIFF